MIKTVAYDAAGREIHIARQEVAIDSPQPGFAEQDMDRVWDAVADTLAEAAKAGNDEVTLIGITGQGDGCWMVDADGRPTGPAVLWNDARAGAIVDDWRRAGRTEQAFRINGSVGFSGLPHAILAWLADHEPGRVDSAAAALTCNGWLFHRLTGVMALDESDAAAPWLDVARRVYSSDVLELFDLGWVKRLLPHLRHDDNRIAPLTGNAASRLEFRAGVPVVMAPYDVAATSIGAGVVERRQACSILGTTLCTQVVTEAVDVSGTPTGLTIPLGVPGRYLRALPTLAGTQVLAWAADQLGFADAGTLCAMAGETEPGADGLMFLPYLSSAGERVPFVDSQARGVLAGLSFNHDRTRIARAVLEGLSYVIRECLDVAVVSAAELRVCGGGANSASWCQLIADVTGVPVIRSTDDEVGARGAFCCALVATVAEPDYATAVAKYVRTGHEFRPVPARHDLYRQLYDDFVAVRTEVASSWPRLADVRARIRT